MRVAFVPPGLLVARRGVFVLPQRGEEFVEVHGGVPFLLRCWLISSIGEDPTLARSRWVKEEAPPARDVQTRHLLLSLTWRGFLPGYQILLFASQAHLVRGIPNYDPSGTQDQIVPYLQECDIRIL